MKHKPTKVWEMVKVEGESVKADKQNCPRCGAGVYMAVHKEKSGKTRQYCGRCHYTVWP